MTTKAYNSEKVNHKRMTSTCGQPLSIHKEKLKQLKINYEIYDIQELKSQVSNQKFHCRKYNYNMDMKVQNFEHQKAFVKIEKDGKYLGLYNSKITEKIDYVLEADPAILEEKQVEHKSMKKMKFGDDIEKDPDVSIRNT